MSGLLFGQVWERDVAGTLRDVLLVYANRANEDGVAWPGVELVAWEVGVSVRQAKRLLAELRRLGALVPVKYEKGGQGNPTWYRANPAALPMKPALVRTSDAQTLLPLPDGRKGDSELSTKGDVQTSPFSAGNGAPQGAQRVTSGATKGDISRTKGDTQMSPESPVESPGNPQYSVATQPGCARVEKSNGSRNGNGQRPRPAARPAAPAPPSLPAAEWTNRRLMGLVRDHLYGLDRKAPRDYDDGRDMGIIQDLQQYGHRSRDEIADAIQGLALLRDRGDLHSAEGVVVTRGAKLTLRYLWANMGVRPVFDLAREAYLAAQKAPRVPVGRRDLTPVAVGAALAGVLPERFRHPP